MKETALQIRKARAQRQPGNAELEKALQLCLTCLENIKPTVEHVGILTYIDATVTAANAVITRD